MTTWDPTIYERYKQARVRPGADLLARLPGPDGVRNVADLGCGTGRLTRVLADRYPDAAVVGVDRSPQMLAAAAAVESRVSWIEGDVASWSPPEPVDLVFSNATLHWLPDHASLFPTLIASVAPGGTFAVQMPRNFDQPSHTLVRQSLIDLGLGSNQLHRAIADAPVSEPARYHDWCAPCLSTLEIWETTYLHALDGDDAVLRWLEGTTLRPVMADLSEEEFARFTEALGPRLRKAYPTRSDGTTLFPFRRVFILGTR